MDLPTLLLIAVGLSMDAFAVAITYGVSFRKREHRFALEIALAFGLFQAVMPLLGWLLGLGLRRYIERFDHWIACAMLLYVGGKMLVDALRRTDEEQPAAPTLDRWVLLGLAVATSIDALAVGLALSLVGASLLGPALLIGATTFAISYLGIVLGHELTGWLRRRGRAVVQAVGGIVLIGIGVRILVAHLLEQGGI